MPAWDNSIPSASALTRAASIALDAADDAALDAVLAEGPGPGGDVYDLERDKGGPHAAIMRYDLNAQARSGTG